MRFIRMLSVAAGVMLLDSCDGNDPSNVPPTAAFDVQCEPLRCTFTNLSTDPDGTLDAYTWDFGEEGAVASTKDAVHSYTTSGRFTVQLSVTDDDGETSTTSEPVDVSAGNTAPTAGFSVSCPELTCIFTDRSFDGDGRVVSFSWDFGDGSPRSLSRDMGHTYASPGEFTVTLTVQDDDGATATTTGQARPHFAPVASFTFSCTDLTCAFTDRSSDAAGSLTGYAWNFGDGATGTERNPVHTYPSAGAHMVELTVTDDRGTTGTASGRVVVPAPEFSVACAALECTFTPAFDPQAGVSWDFGDGETSTEVSPTHVYEVTETTTFTVTVLVWSVWPVDADINSREVTVSP